MKIQIQENPLSGKPIHSDWLKEKKFEDKRLYYLVSKTKQAILLIGFGDKKKQKKMIAQIVFDQWMYWKFIEGVEVE